MNNPFTKLAMRARFTATTRRQALNQAERALQDYMALAKRVTAESGRIRIRIPTMRGVDKNMRNWSFFMILEHNTIVNRVITTRICHLARNEPLIGADQFDPKKDVMPTDDPGDEQLDFFQDSILKHIEAVRSLGKLRRTKVTPHPVFGEFDAHKWNCMFPFHLRIHLQQAEYVTRISSDPTLIPSDPAD